MSTTKDLLPYFVDLKRNRCDLPCEILYNSEQSARSSQLKRFALQSDAFQYSKKNNDLPVWSKDKELSHTTKEVRAGAKEFIVGSYDRFWECYCTLSAVDRVYYEILNPNKPCRLYIDAEFQKKPNSGTDGEDAMAFLETTMSTFITKRFQEAGLPQAYVSFRTLDSSGVDKFSRHILVIIEISNNVAAGKTEVLFVDNLHVGAFIRDYHVYIAKNYEDETITLLYANRELNCEAPHVKTSLAFVVDLGIYTKNRSYRICFSTKLGKNRFLRPIDFSQQRLMTSLQLKDQKDDCVTLRRMFLENLVQYIATDSRYCLVFWPWPNGGGEPISSSNLTGHLQDVRDEFFERTGLIKPVKLQKRLWSKTFTQSKHLEETTDSMDKEAVSFASGSTMVSAARNQMMTLIQNMLQHITKSKVYPIKYIDGSLYLSIGVYNTECVLAGRSHKSNNTKYDINFMSMEYSPGCFDMECKGTKSPWKKPLPIEVIQAVRNYFDAFRSARSSYRNPAVDNDPNIVSKKIKLPSVTGNQTGNTRCLDEEEIKELLNTYLHKTDSTLYEKMGDILLREIW